MAKILLKRADLWSRHIYNKREVYFKGYILNNGKSITGIEASLLMFKLIPSLDSDNFSNQVKLILLKVDGGLGTRIVAEALTRPGPLARRILRQILA